MSDPQVQVVANVDPTTNEPLLGDCTLTVGDGSEKIVFTRGRAIVPQSIYEAYLSHRSDLSVMGLPASGDAPLTAPSTSTAQPGAQIVQAANAEGLTEEGLPEGVDSDELAGNVEALAELKAAAAVAEKEKEIAALRTQLAAATGKTPTPGPVSAEDAAKIEAGEVSPEVAAAQEHLAEEGEEIPEPEPEGEPEEQDRPERVVPDGFDDKTSDDEPRCLAAKADGKQCANPAVTDDHGALPWCRLPAHKAKFE